MVTRPFPASMWTLFPVESLLMRPPDTPTIVGRPSSLATTAEWDSRLCVRVCVCMCVPVKCMYVCAFIIICTKVHA